MKPAVLILLLLASCATPAPPSATGGAVMDGLQAAATQTTIATTAQAAPIMTAAARATAGSMADSATRQAGIVATMTAVPMQTEQARNAERAASIANAENQIKLDAIATRETLKTIATRGALQLAADEAEYNATRRDIVKTALWVAFFAFFFVGSVVLFKILLFKNRTILTANGEPIVINGDWLMDEEPEPLQLPAPRIIPFTPTNGETVAINAERESIALTRKNGRAITYTFTGANLDAMENNIIAGDFGFRRSTSTSGRGMDELIGLSNGDLYNSILAVMKERGWVRTSGNGNKWTHYGVRELLDMDGLPQQSEAGE